MKQIIPCFLLFLFMCFPWRVNAEVYKWVDEQGHTQYGEKPPDSSATQVRIKGNPESSPEVEKTIEEHNEERDKLLKIYEEERAEKKAEQAEIEQKKKEQMKKCQTAENELKNMKEGGVFYDLDENGERVFLSDEEVAGRTREMQAEYDKHCK